MTHHHRSEHDLTIDTANGSLTVSSKDWLIGKHLFTRREYEIDFIRSALNHLEREGFLNEKKRTVVDIGANMGMICIPLVLNSSFADAIAFEPGPRNFRLLTNNVDINGLSSKIRCYPLHFRQKMAKYYSSLLKRIQATAGLEKLRRSAR